MQVAFNAATLILSSSVAYKFGHIVQGVSGTESSMVCLLLAASIYFPLNSVLISTVIGLVEGQALNQVFRRC